MVSDLSGDQTGKILGVSGPRGVREMRMMEKPGWKPPHTGWKAQDIVEHASEIFFSEEEIKMGGAAVLTMTGHLRRSFDHAWNDGKRRGTHDKLTHKAAGTFAIAPTPFHDDGRIDDKSIDRLTDFYAEVGCDGVTVLGILGEAPKLEGSEAEAVAKRFVKRAGKMQIIVGVSAPGFAAMRSLARASMDAGAAGVMIAPPPTLAHRRPDHRLFQAGGGSDRRRHSLGAAGLSADLVGGVHAGGDPQDRDGSARPA